MWWKLESVIPGTLRVSEWGSVEVHMHAHVCVEVQNCDILTILVCFLLSSSGASCC